MKTPNNWVLGLTSAATVASLMLASAPASAAEVNPGPVVNGIAPEDGNYEDSAYAQSVKSEADALEALYQVYGDAVSGNASAGEVARAVSKFEEKTGQTAEDAAPIPELAKLNSGMVMSRSEVAAAKTANSLLMTHVAQAYNNYCGPATGKMILLWEGKTKSAANSDHTLTQNRLTTSAYMRTNLHGSTNWGDGDMPHGVNTFYGGTYLVQHKAPSLSVFVGAITSNIDNYDSAAVGTTEIASSIHYNHHLVGTTIRHWIAVKGYTTDAVGASYLDPATSVWSEVAQSFNHTSSTFLTRYVKPEYGIAS